MSDRLATKRPTLVTATIASRPRGRGLAAAVSLFGLALAAGGTGVAVADDTFVVRVPLDRTASGAPGSTVLLDQVTVEPGLVGRSCDASYEGDNNGSVHPDTDLIITSGSTTVVLDDVEASPGRITNAVGELTLGSTVQVSVRLGGHGFSSLGATLTIVCASPATTTSPATTPTTLPDTTAPGTTAPDTSVAVGPPPVPTTVPLSSVAEASETSSPTPASTTTLVGSAGPVPSPPGPSTATSNPSTSPITPGASAGSGGPGGSGGTLPTTGSDPGLELSVALLSLLTGALLWRIRLPRSAG